jgi:hypothetical protein
MRIIEGRVSSSLTGENSQDGEGSGFADALGLQFAVGGDDLQWKVLRLM